MVKRIVGSIAKRVMRFSERPSQPVAVAQADGPEEVFKASTQKLMQSGRRLAPLALATAVAFGALAGPAAAVAAEGMTVHGADGHQIAQVDTRHNIILGTYGRIEDDQGLAGRVSDDGWVYRQGSLIPFGGVGEMGYVYDLPSPIAECRISQTGEVTGSFTGRHLGEVRGGLDDTKLELGEMAGGAYICLQEVFPFR